MEAFEILEEIEAPKTKKLAGRILGLFDGLKLKPPKDSSKLSQEGDAAGVGSASTAAPKSSASSPNMGGANGASVPSQASQQASQQTSQQGFAGEDVEDEDEEDFGNQRPLSKAERKKLRRQGRDAA